MRARHAPLVTSREGERMTENEHRERHRKLHESFDELLADYIGHTGNLPSKTTLSDFLQWSYEQTQKPVPAPGNEHDPEPDANPKP